VAPPDANGLLAGLRVLDLTIWRPGPYATQLLAELGADVLKVEPPGGDPMRSYPELFASMSANKRSIVVDLKSDQGRQRALELAADADVVIEGFRPGVVDRLGVGPEAVREVNPDVVYCSLSGMGQDGELAMASGHDLNYLAWAGALAPNGGEPALPAIPVADLAGGMAAALAVCAAMIRRRATGEGERIDVAMGDILATWTGAALPRVEGVDPGARGSPGYGMFPTADGRHMTLALLTEDHFWRPLCDTLELDELRELPFVERAARVDEMQARLADAIVRRERDELVGALLAAGVPAAPVHDRAEMLASEHFRARGIVTADPWADPASGYPIRFERHPAARVAPPPAADEHRGATWLPR
jgi:crotonobetainyl-CoA:carnitine CoA-transferase CaiB-like acyl-CoA transferase